MSDYTFDDQALQQAFSEDIERLTVDLLREIRANTGKMLRTERSYRRGFERRLTERWKKPLDLAEVIWLVSYESGSVFNSEYRPQAVAENDLVFEALIHLHARACRTLAEVLALLRSGFADGAHSRWRTLHELAVVAFFVKEHGQDVANRYLLHETIESCKAAKDHEKYHARIGDDPLDESEVAELRRTRERLLAQFGARYGDPWGWADQAIRTIDPSFPPKHEVKFRKLEQATGLDHLRPYYRMASHTVHAGPKGLRFSLGQKDRGNILLSGASNAGLADPVHGACISLQQVTVALLNHKPNVQRLARLKALGSLVDEAGQAFLEVHHQLEAEVRAEASRASPRDQ